MMLFSCIMGNVGFSVFTLSASTASIYHFFYTSLQLYGCATLNRCTALFKYNESMLTTVSCTELQDTINSNTQGPDCCVQTTEKVQ